MTFVPPDFHKFPAVSFGHEALIKGGTAPAVLNAANEEAIQCFIQQKIKFNHITKLVENTLDRHHTVPNPDLDEILAADIWARNFVKEAVGEQEVLEVSF